MTVYQYHIFLRLLLAIIYNRQMTMLALDEVELLRVEGVGLFAMWLERCNFLILAPAGRARRAVLFLGEED